MYVRHDKMQTLVTASMLSVLFLPLNRFASGDLPTKMPQMIDVMICIIFPFIFFQLISINKQVLHQFNNKLLRAIVISIFARSIEQLARTVAAELRRANDFMFDVNSHVYDSVISLASKRKHVRSVQTERKLSVIQKISFIIIVFY